MCLSEPLELYATKSLNVNLWALVIVSDQCWLVNCNKCTTLNNMLITGDHAGEG